MKNSSEGLAEISNFRMLGDQLGTAGQPTDKQLRAIRGADFEVVINLALPTSDNALANEGSIVTGLGMRYVHIPVDFQVPLVKDYKDFCGIMKALEGRKVFVHCAANKRVSAFLFLYRVRQQQVSVPEAETDLRAIWQPDEVWSQFIREQLVTTAT